MTTLMKRLEAATSRLEDLVVVSQNHGATQLPPQSTDPAAAAVPVFPPAPSTLASDSKALDSGATSAPPVPSAPVASSEPSVPSSLTALDAKLATLVELSQAIDPALGEQAKLFESAAKSANSVVVTAAQAQAAEMGSPEYMELLKPLSEKISAVVEFREANRSCSASNHLATIAEGVPALGWVSSPAPADYVQDFKDSAQFYANRVLKDNKEHGDWVKAFLSYLNELKTAVKQDFAKGLNWNPSGKPLGQVLAAGSAAAPAPAPTPATGGPPPPAPPPPSVESLTQTASQGTSSGAPSGMAAVLADLNKGTDITSGLRHVDRSAKKEAPKAPPKPGSLKKPKPGVSASSASSAPARKPRTELENNRWIVENHVDEHEIVIDAELSQAILIDNCQQCTIQIKGKATSVTVTKCVKTGVLVDTLVSGVEIINSSNFGLQITGTVASLSIDNSHDGSVYLSEAALDIDVYTSQTAAININIPTGEPGDYVEKPLPEQIVHKISGQKVISTAVNAAEK